MQVISVAFTLAIFGFLEIGAEHAGDARKGSEVELLWFFPKV
jgi:hypothetical protein